LSSQKNRLVDDTGGVEKSKAIQQLDWNQAEAIPGKRIKIKGFPGARKVKLSGPLSLPTRRNLSLLTIKIKTQKMPYNRGTMFVGKLKSFTANLSN